MFPDGGIFGKRFTLTSKARPCLRSEPLQRFYNQGEVCMFGSHRLILARPVSQEKGGGNGVSLYIYIALVLDILKSETGGKERETRTGISQDNRNKTLKKHL